MFHTDDLVRAGHDAGAAVSAETGKKRLLLCLRRARYLAMLTKRRRRGERFRDRTQPSPQQFTATKASMLEAST